MSEQIYYCFESHNVEAAAKIMAEHQVRRLVLTRTSGSWVVALADRGRRDGDSAQKVLEGSRRPKEIEKSIRRRNAAAAELRSARLNEKNAKRHRVKAAGLPAGKFVKGGSLRNPKCKNRGRAESRNPVGSSQVRIRPRRASHLVDTRSSTPRWRVRRMIFANNAPNCKSFFGLLWRAISAATRRHEGRAATGAVRLTG